MAGIWVLLTIIAISSIPVIIVYIWFRIARYQFSFILLLFALLAGAAAFFPALIMQGFLPCSCSAGNRITLFYHFFVHIAFTEELSRLLLLSVFIWMSARIAPGSLSVLLTDRRRDNVQAKAPLQGQSSLLLTIRRGTAIGLVAGLGFAVFENAAYAASDVTVLPLRIIITAAIHGACSSRIGAAAVMLRANPLQAFLRILTAIAIHGIYNLMLNMPGFSPIAAILIAISALFTAVLTISGGRYEDISQLKQAPRQNLEIPLEPQPAFGAQEPSALSPSDTPIDKSGENA